jgi:DNA-binding response OmpR family regulator
MPKPAVLVVEDEENIQTTLSIALSLSGFRTFTAANVDEALAILGREQIDAITLDVRMPDPKGLDRDGLTLLEYLRDGDAYANVPVLLLTGKDLHEHEVRAIIRLNAKLFFKPQPYEEIIEELNRCLLAQ